MDFNTQPVKFTNKLINSFKSFNFYKFDIYTSQSTTYFAYISLKYNNSDCCIQCNNCEYRGYCRNCGYNDCL